MIHSEKVPLQNKLTIKCGDCKKRPLNFIFVQDDMVYAGANV